MHRRPDYLVGPTRARIASRAGHAPNSATDDRFQSAAGGTVRSPRRRRTRKTVPAPDDRYATRSVVSPGAADGCFARMMGKPTGARLTSDDALRLSWGVGLLVRHERTRRLGGGAHHPYGDRADTTRHARGESQHRLVVRR